MVPKPVVYIDIDLSHKYLQIKTKMELALDFELGNQDPVHFGGKDLEGKDPEPFIRIWRLGADAEDCKSSCGTRRNEKGCESRTLYMGKTGLGRT